MKCRQRTLQKRKINRSFLAKHTALGGGSCSAIHVCVSVSPLRIFTKETQFDINIYIRYKGRLTFRREYIKREPVLRLRKQLQKTSSVVLISAYSPSFLAQQATSQPALAIIILSYRTIVVLCKRDIRAKRTLVFIET